MTAIYRTTIEFTADSMADANDVAHMMEQALLGRSSVKHELITEKTEFMRNLANQYVPEEQETGGSVEPLY